jgi:hypothetical protein
MTAMCSGMEIIKPDNFFFVSETSMQDVVYTSLIQRIVEYEIILGLMAYTSTLITRSRGGALQVWIYISIYIYQRSKDVIKNISPLLGNSLGTTSPDSTGSSKISYAKTGDFLDFVEMKSKSNSWRTTIHILIFPPITCRVNMY